MGPTRALKFKIPTAQSEKYFDESFDTIIQNYTSEIKQLHHPNFAMPDKDFDTGKPTEPCEYSLADETYNSWLLHLKNDKFKNVTIQIKQNINDFYYWTSSLQKKKYSKQCNELFNAINDLKNYSIIH